MRIDSFGHSSGGRSGGTVPRRARDTALTRAVTEPPARNDAPRDEAADQAASPDRSVLRPKSAVPGRLVALMLSGPVLAITLLMIGMPRATSLLFLACWSLVQVPLGMLPLERRLHDRSADRQALDEDAAAGREDSGEDSGEDTRESEADRAKDRLHEVRATVAGIGLTHRLLSDDHVPISGADRGRLERLYDREITRLERLLQDDDRPAQQEVDVHSAVDPVVESLRVSGHQVMWEGTEAIAVGRADDIAEIVHILLQNAARHAPGAPAAVRVESIGTQLLVQVSDDGPGVPSALAPHLFDRGVRGPESPGEGIGLNIARRLAREMGGDVVLEPGSVGGGATFTVVLPASPETAPCLVRQS
jgi:signal transduction histidine kinase